MINKIESIVSENFGATPEEVKSKKRNRNIVDARHFLYYVLFYNLGYKQIVIANMYGVTRRNVSLSIIQIHDGIRIQPFYSKNYKKIQKSLIENGVI